MHLSVEGLRPWDWSYPVLHFSWEWPTPTICITGSVVKHQPTNVICTELSTPKGVKLVCGFSGWSLHTRSSTSHWFSMALDLRCPVHWKTTPLSLQSERLRSVHVSEIYIFLWRVIRFFIKFWFISADLEEKQTEVFYDNIKGPPEKVIGDDV